MKTKDMMEVKVSIIGFINDCKFTAEGSGRIDCSCGKANIELNYSECPPNWNPLNYSDPLVLLAGYGEVDGGKNFISLAKDGYDAESTFSFGEGMSLRKTATIRVEGDRLIANYAIVGNVRAGHITGIQDYEEYLIPVAKDQLIAVGLARWDTSDKPLEALVSTRYWFKEPREMTNKPMVRGFHVTAETPKSRQNYKATYITHVKPMANLELISDRVVRHGPYDRLQG